LCPTRFHKHFTCFELCKKRQENFLDILCVQEEEANIINSNTKEDWDVSNYKIGAIDYIAGFIVKKIKQIINCDYCSKALVDELNCHILIDIKNCGGLNKPANDVIRICQISENTFKLYIINAINSKNNPIQFLILKCMANIDIHNYFKTINEHIYTQSPLNNHLLQIIKL